MNAHDLIQEIIERKGKIENVFWIACGGSMIDLMPANELLKRRRRGRGHDRLRGLQDR